MHLPQLVRSFSAAALLLAAIPATAAVQFGLGGGTSDGRDDEGHHNRGTHYALTTNQGGLMINIGRERRPFQYRLELDWLNGRLEDFRNGSTPVPGHEEYEGYMIGHHFGFRLDPRSRQSLWFGPCLYTGKVSFDDSERNADLRAIGATIGMDFPMVNGNTLTASFSYREGVLIRSDNDPAPDRHFQEPLFRVGLLFGD